MEYKVNYSDYYRAFSLIFDKVIVNINLDTKHHNIKIKIVKASKTNRKNINLSKYLEEIIKFIQKEQMLCKKDNCDFRIDILNLANVKYLDLESLKLEQHDIEIISNKFKNLRILKTKKCTLYHNCNLGILKCDFVDYDSDIYGLDIFNCFQGEILCLTRSNIKYMNKNVLRLNNIVTRFRGININYEYFFLTTDAPNMRKIEIYRSPKYSKLNDNDLLFLSGFYNLESVHIDAYVSSYEQLEKLEKLREIDRVFCLEDENLEVVKIREKRYFERLLKDGATDSRIKSFLVLNRLQIQNKYQEVFHKLYVPRLERVKWQDKINKNDLQQIKDELLIIQSMNNSERRDISREPKREYNFFDETFGLWFDHVPSQDSEVIERDSRPFQDGGIKYYYLKKIYIPK